MNLEFVFLSFLQIVFLDRLITRIHVLYKNHIYKYLFKLWWKLNCF